MWQAGTVGIYMYLKARLKLRSLMFCFVLDRRLLMKTSCIRLKSQKMENTSTVVYISATKSSKVLELVSNDCYDNAL